MSSRYGKRGLLLDLLSYERYQASFIRLKNWFCSQSQVKQAMYIKLQNQQSKYQSNHSLKNFKFHVCLYSE